jgi:hypothetical protein
LLIVAPPGEWVSHEKKHETCHDSEVVLLIRELLDVLQQTRHENEQLQDRLEPLGRRLYAPRTERFDPNQPLLIADLSDALNAAAAQDPPPTPELQPEPAAAAKKKQHDHGRFTWSQCSVC